MILGKKGATRSRAVIAALVAGGVLIGGAFAAGASFGNDVSNSAATPASGDDLEGVALESVDPATVRLAFRDFPETKDGVTYGSDARAESIDQAPDLIATVTDDGRFGFLRKEDVYFAPSTPEEALAYQEDLEKNGPTPDPVYDLEGNQIGVSTPVMPEVSYQR